jgi:GDPmannose 4,6-dehydratase
LSRSIQSQITIHKGDITDPYILIQLLREIQPDEIYHLAAQSHVSQSFATPEYTFQVNMAGTLNLLQAVVVCGLQRKTRIYNVRNILPDPLMSNLTPPRYRRGWIIGIRRSP